MGIYDRGDPDIGVTRSQLALGVRRDKPHAYRIGDIGGPLVLAILWMFLPFDASDTARWVGASVIFALGPLDQLGRHRLPPEWSNYFLLVVRTVIASLLAAAVPLMWYPAAVLLMGIAAGSTTVESPNRVGALTLFSLTSLSAVGLIRGVEHWYLVMAAFAVTMGAHWLWFREWRAERSEVDRRHEEMVDRARMFYGKTVRPRLSGVLDAFTTSGSTGTDPTGSDSRTTSASAQDAPSSAATGGGVGR